MERYEILKKTAESKDLKKSLANLTAMMEATDMPLYELFEYVPPEVVLCHLSQFIKQIKSKTGLSLPLQSFWSAFANNLIENKSYEEITKKHTTTDQDKLRKIIIRTIPGLIVNQTLKDVKDITKIITNFELTSEEISYFALVWRYSNQKQQYILDIVKKHSNNMDGMSLSIDLMLDDIIRKCRFNKLCGFQTDYQDSLSQLLDNQTFKAIIVQIIKQDNEAIIVQHFCHYLYKLTMNTYSEVCLTNAMKCLILITASNIEQSSDTFKDVMYNFIRRLLIEALFRYDFNLLLPFFKHYDKIKKCISKDNMERFNLFTMEVMLCIGVILSMEITTPLFSDHAQAVKQFTISMVKENRHIKSQYSMWTWPMEQINQIFSSKNKKPNNDQETLMKMLYEDIDNLGKQCTAFRLQTIFLTLNHIKYLISLLRQLPEAFDHPLLLSIHGCLSQFRKYANTTYENLQNSHLFQATTVLCSWITKYCTDGQLPQLTSTLSVLKPSSSVDQMYSQLQTYILQQITIRQLGFSCGSIYWLKKSASCAKNKKKYQIPRVRIKEDMFKFPLWLESLSKYKLKTSFSFFQIFFPALDDVQIACLSTALIILSLAQEKKPIKQIIHTLFNQYIFNDLMQLNFKIAFLMVPETISIWNMNNSLIYQAYQSLDPNKLSSAYVSIECWKGAIRYLDKTINLDNIKNAYIYECRLNDQYSAIPFTTVCAQFGIKTTQNIQAYETELETYERVNDVTRKAIYTLRRDKNLKRNRVMFNRLRWLCLLISTLMHREEIMTLIRLVKYVECMRTIVAICNQEVTGVKQLQMDEKKAPSAAGQVRLRQIIKNMNKIIRMKMHPTVRPKTIHILLDILNSQIFHMFSYVKQVRQRVERFNSQAILSLIETDQTVQSAYLSYILKPLDKIRIYFRLNDYSIVQSLCEKQLQSRIANPKLDGSDGWLELIYYHIKCKTSLSILQFDLRSTVRWIMRVEYHPSQTLHLSSILYQFINLNIIQKNIKQILDYVGEWLENSQDQEDNQILLFSLLRFILHKATTMDPRFQSQIIDVCDRNLGAVSHSTIELLIAKINDKKDIINNIASRMLEKIALRRPDASIWWVSRLAHFCDYSGELDKITEIQKNLFCAVDIEKYALGTKIMNSISNLVDKETLSVLNTLYFILEMRSKKELMEPNRVRQSTIEEINKWKMNFAPTLKISQGVQLPFQRSIIVDKIDAKASQGQSKCLTKFINITYRKQDSKSTYKGKLLLKGQFKISNRGLEVSAGQLFCSIIPPELGISYCIMPISKYSMLIQFVDGFQDVRKFIDGCPKNKVQAEASSQIKKQMDAVSNKAQNPTFFQGIYQKYHKKVQPVLHHFLDNHQSLESWWNARQNYIRTTAIWSIIGYIFGLGDRHSGNILLNCQDGKVIHVDYEYLLDTGKNLPKPEYVPFRMTKNIESPMGILGAYGTFYIQAIKEMQRLQRLQSTILDSLSLFKISNSSNQQDKLTDIVLGRLRPKESLEENVLKLIQTSKNDDLLARMFYGWNSLQ